MQLLKAGSSVIHELAFAPDGGALVAPAGFASPVLWDLPASGDPVPLIAKPENTCTSFTFSPDSQVVSWACMGKRHEHDRGTGTARTVDLLPPGEGLAVQRACGPTGRLVVRTYAGNDQRIRSFVPDDTGGWRESWCVGPDDTIRGRAMRCSADGERVFTWEEPRWNTPGAKRLVVRSAHTGEVLHAVNSPAWVLGGFAAAPDGSVLVTFKDSSLFVWRPGEKLQKVRTDTLRHYRALAFHPDGRHLLAGNNDTTARLIDTHTWQVVRQYTWNVGRLVSVAVSPDGQLAAAGGDKGRLMLWDLDL